VTTATKTETSAVSAVTPRAISPAPMPALVALANHHSYTASGTIDMETAADLLDAVNRRRAVLEQQLLRQMDAS